MFQLFYDKNSSSRCVYYHVINSVVLEAHNSVSFNYSYIVYYMFAITKSNSARFNVAFKVEYISEVTNRARKICKRLGFSKRLMDLAQFQDGPKLDSAFEEISANLSRTDRKLIHLARALIYNPEVLPCFTLQYFTVSISCVFPECFES